MATISNHTHIHGGHTYNTETCSPFPSGDITPSIRGTGKICAASCVILTALIGLKYRRRVVRCGMALQHARNGTGNGMEPGLKCNQEWMGMINGKVLVRPSWSACRFYTTLFWDGQKQHVCVSVVAKLLIENHFLVGKIERD